MPLPRVGEFVCRTLKFQACSCKNRSFRRGRKWRITLVPSKTGVIERGFLASSGGPRAEERIVK